MAMGGAVMANPPTLRAAIERILELYAPDIERDGRVSASGLHTDLTAALALPDAGEGKPSLTLEDYVDLENACRHLSEKFAGTTGEKPWRDLAAKCRAHAEPETGR